MRSADVAKALSAITRRDGLLRAEDVVKVAEDPESPLHDCFEWDDGAAAHEYRIWQARKLIVNVRIFRDSEAEKPVSVFVSLAQDRTLEAGGYRTVVDVARDPKLRQAMLDTALGELQAFERRYERIKDDLSLVFEAIERTVKQTKRVKRKAG